MHNENGGFFTSPITRGHGVKTVIVCDQQQFEDYAKEAKMENNKEKTLAKKIYESLNEVDYDPNHSSFGHLDDNSKQMFVDLSSSLIDGSFFHDTSKIEKQYKYVNAGIKTVGELVDRLLDDEELYNMKHKLIDYLTIDRYEVRKLREIVLDRITTRQPLQWYEVEGVFDVPKWVKDGNGEVYLVVSFDGNELVIYKDEGHILPSCCTPLTPTEAAKYGVGE